MPTAMTKSEYIRALAERLDLDQASVRVFLEVQEEVITGALKSAKADVRVPVIPGLVTAHKKKKKGRKAHMGKNPFTGEEVFYEAKPASIAVKVTALKRLKEVI